MIAWRNLWRNRRRTLFTAGSIAFACLLLMFSRSLQLGSYTGMIDAATELFAGHAQVQHEDFLDDPRLRYRIENAAALVDRLAAVPGVAQVAPRGQAFALWMISSAFSSDFFVISTPESMRAISSTRCLSFSARTSVRV